MSSETDVLRWPLIGRLLRWKHFRTLLQSLLLFVAVTMTAHGLFGPQIAGANLGTVLLWVHYRGILALFLLAAGNFFCTACPMVLVRDIGRRFHAPNRSWPRWLRTKWPAVVLTEKPSMADNQDDLRHEGSSGDRRM